MGFIDEEVKDSFDEMSDMNGDGNDDFMENKENIKISKRGNKIVSEPFEILTTKSIKDCETVDDYDLFYKEFFNIAFSNGMTDKEYKYSVLWNDRKAPFFRTVDILSYHSEEDLDIALFRNEIVLVKYEDVPDPETLYDFDEVMTEYVVYIVTGGGEIYEWENGE